MGTEQCKMLTGVTETYTALTKLIKRQSCHHIETNKLICFASQPAGICMMTTLTFNELSVKNPRAILHQPPMCPYGLKVELDIGNIR